MKKLICLLLVICLICPLLSGCINQDPDLRMKKAYIRQFGIKDVKPEDVVIDYDGGTYNGARIVMLDTEWHDPETKTEYFGKAAFEYYDSNRLFVYKYGRFFDLNKAFSLSILQEEDYVKIAKEYRAQIKSFINVCDKYDFEPFQKMHLGTDHIDFYGENKCSDRLWIYFDSNWLFGLSSNLKEDREKIVEYINSYLKINLVSGISTFIDYEPYMDMWSTQIYLNNDNIENIPQIMEQLSSVPGIMQIFCHCQLIRFGTQAANDVYYADGLWGLHYIQVEKVWDFTMCIFNI